MRAQVANGLFLDYEKYDSENVCVLTTARRVLCQDVSCPVDRGVLLVHNNRSFTKIDLQGRILSGKPSSG